MPVFSECERISQHSSTVIRGDHFAPLKRPACLNDVRECCYRRDAMAVLNMVRQNVFGELTPFARRLPARLYAK